MNGWAYEDISIWDKSLNVTVIYGTKGVQNVNMGATSGKDGVQITLQMLELASARGGPGRLLGALATTGKLRILGGTQHCALVSSPTYIFPACQETRNTTRFLKSAP